MKIEIDIIQRTLKTTSIASVLIALILLYYYGVPTAISFFSGSIWSILNLVFLSSLIRHALRPEGIDKFAVIGIAIIKFPLLYAAAYFLVVNEYLPLIPVIIGFSFALVVIILKALSRALFKLDVFNQEQGNRGLA